MSDCAKCHQPMEIDQADEATELCHQCAHEAVEELTERIVKLEEIIFEFRVAVAFVASMRPGAEDAFAKAIRASDELRKSASTGQ